MDILQSIFFFFLTYILTIRIAKYFRVNQSVISLIFLMKFILSYLYIPIARDLDHDAYGYFMQALNQEGLYKYWFGSDAIFRITSFLRIFFNLNIISVTLLFSLIGEP